MKINKTMLIFSGIIFIIVILFGYLYFNQRKENLLLRQMISEKGSRGNNNKKEADPYLANEVKNRVLKGYGEMNKCYKEYLAKNPKIIEGSIVADRQIDTNGKAISPEIVASDFKDPEFEDALKKAVAGWMFPEPPLKKYVTHTFRFKMEKKLK